MASMPNVYLDSSAVELMLYPTEFKAMLKRWLELYPDKITFGTDAFPYGEALGVEEAYWLGVNSARTALAASNISFSDRSRKRCCARPAVPF